MFAKVVCLRWLQFRKTVGPHHLGGDFDHLGPPVVPFSPLFGVLGSPKKSTKKKKHRVPFFYPLQSGGPSCGFLASIPCTHGLLFSQRSSAGGPSHGYGSKLQHQGTACFGPCFPFARASHLGGHPISHPFGCFQDHLFGLVSASFWRGWKGKSQESRRSRAARSCSTWPRCCVAASRRTGRWPGAPGGSALRTICLGVLLVVFVGVGGGGRGCRGIPMGMREAVFVFFGGGSKGTKKAYRSGSLEGPSPKTRHPHFCSTQNQRALNQGPVNGALCLVSQFPFRKPTCGEALTLCANHAALVWRVPDGELAA